MQELTSLSTLAYITGGVSCTETQRGDCNTDKKAKCDVVGTLVVVSMLGLMVIGAIEVVFSDGHWLQNYQQQQYYRQKQNEQWLLFKIINGRKPTPPEFAAILATMLPPL